MYQGSLYSDVIASTVNLVKLRLYIEWPNDHRSPLTAELFAQSLSVVMS